MASCEKCWVDAAKRARGNSDKSQEEHYHDLIAERSHSPCTPEEQAGPGARVCPTCKRPIVHQFTHCCVICGCEPELLQ